MFRDAKGLVRACDCKMLWWDVKECSKAFSIFHNDPREDSKMLMQKSYVEMMEVIMRIVDDHVTMSLGQVRIFELGYHSYFEEL